MRQQASSLPSKLPIDPGYRRLRYIRYADDFLLGFTGPKSEADKVKRQIGDFLRHTLKPELSDEKTLITHGRTEAARFLGYEVSILKDDTKRTKGRRSINGVVGLRIPVGVVRAKCKPYMRNGKPIHRTSRLHDSVYSIVAAYQMEFRGIVEYYRLAHNLHQLGRLRWVMERSLTKTLAAKLRVSAAQAYKRYKADLITPEGTRKGLRVTVEEEGRTLVAQWGGISLQAQHQGGVGRHTTQDMDYPHRTRTTAPGRSPKPYWVRLMAARQRKTLVLCQPCHTDVHHGRPDTDRPHTD